jgi:hypothetical protein
LSPANKDLPATNGASSPPSWKAKINPLAA